MNKIIKNLILTDIAFWTGWGMVTPVFAIFITDRIVGGTALTVGIAVSIYWLCRSLLVFPFAKIVDKCQGQKDGKKCDGQHKDGKKCDGTQKREGQSKLIIK